MKRLLALVAIVTLPVTISAQPANQQQPGSTAQPAVPAQAGRPAGVPDESALKALKWRTIGPVGNRVTSVTGIPGNPATYYLGATSGGVWKTADGGVSWEPIFDQQSAQSIGSLAVAPSDPNIVWAGTGEQCIRSHISLGDGIYKSTDAGRTWNRMGLEKTGRIGRIVVDPQNPDRVLACSLGHAYGPQPDRGVFKTTDGGKTWDRVLFVDENTGCSALEMDPGNPRVLYAGMWQFEIHTWGRESGGPSSGLYKSTDQGATWRRITGSELPKKPFGKVALSVSASNPNRVYALIETGDGVPRGSTGEELESGQLWRSDDAGETWRLVSHDRNAGGRTHYYFHVFTAPDNENELYFLTASFSKSIDAGQTIQPQQFRNSPGGDNHSLWMDPDNPARMIVGNDGGVSISVNRGRTWDRINLPIAQVYHVTTDNQVPYYVMGNRQDGPSFRGPSYSRTGGFGGGGIARGAWHSIGGGESGWAIPDPRDPNVIWASGTGSGGIGGSVDVMNLKSGHFRRVEIWPDSPLGGPAKDAKYRFNWTFPLHLSPYDPSTVYAGSQFVHRTTNGGQSWEVISPDLTLNDRNRQGFSGGLTGDNIGVEYAGVVMAIAESPREKGLIWVGTNDGLVQVTRNGGKVWSNVTSAIPNLPPWGTVYSIEPSRHKDGTAYAAFDFHQVNNRDPYVYRTNDYGRTWKSLSATLPKGPLSYVHCIKEDPVRPGLLYLGTENGIYVSWNDGEDWQALQNNLPHAPVYWITVQEHFSDLVIATYGRGFWIMDDITPLRQLGADPGAVTLLSPRAAYRYQQIANGPAAVNGDPMTGQNPEYGAAINYWIPREVRLQAGATRDGLKTAATTQAPPVITISDAQGNVVRTLRGTGEAGLNRVYWDLRGEPTVEVKLRTKPLYANWVPMRDDGTRPYPGNSRVAILQPPGTYTVKLSFGGREQAQTLVVRKDPNSIGSEADIANQLALLEETRANLNAVAEMINDVEIMRRQIAGLQEVLPPEASSLPIRDAAADLEKRLIAVEGNLYQMRYTGSGQDTTRWPNMTLEKLMHFAGDLAIGDFPPTDQQREVHRLYTDRIAGYRSELAQIVRTHVAEFNQLLRDRGIGAIMVRRTGTD